MTQNAVYETVVVDTAAIQKHFDAEKSIRHIRTYKVPAYNASFLKWNLNKKFDLSADAIFDIAKEYGGVLDGENAVIMKNTKDQVMYEADYADGEWREERIYDKGMLMERRGVKAAERTEFIESRIDRNNVLSERCEIRHEEDYDIVVRTTFTCYGVDIREQYRVYPATQTRETRYEGFDDAYLMEMRFRNGRLIAAESAELGELDSHELQLYRRNGLDAVRQDRAIDAMHEKLQSAKPLWKKILNLHIA